MSRYQSRIHSRVPRKHRAGRLLPMMLLLLALLPLTSTGAAEGEGTEVLVRVLAREAKLIGDAVGGARVTVTASASGEVLAAGVVRGATGNTRAIMDERRGSRTGVFDTPDAAGWRARFELTEPTLVTIAAEGPLAYPWALVRASKTLLLTPGTTIAGGGLVLELHGYIVELLDTQATSEDDIPVLARVRMLCSCPTEPGGLWTAGTVTATVSDGGEVIGSTTLTYAGEASRYAGRLPRPAPGTYRLRVTAADPANENFGQIEARLEVPAAGGAVIVTAPMAAGGR